MRYTKMMLFCLALVIGSCSAGTSSKTPNTQIPDHSNVSGFIANCVQLKENALTTLSMQDTACVILQETPSSGYQWHATIVDPAVLAAQDDAAFNEDHDDFVGARATHIWKFKPLKKDRAKIIFLYYRQWEGTEQAARRFFYDVQVQ